MKNFIAWVEIPTVDFTRAVKFYNSIFKMDMQAIDCGEEKMACFPNCEGAIFYAPNYKPSADGVIVSFNTENDLDNTIDRVEKNGGKIIKPKTKIMAENRGYFALFIDPEGNRIGLYGDN